ncbi:MAG: class I SAM-dependent methyltransferase [Cytophagaceae bacterium]|nr:class I SAM-dependent methyltransferase [Gemmatimonadaceae bacterium]
MARRHLFEWEDQPWLPVALRDGATDYLRFMIELGDAYGAASPILADAMRRSRATRITDLCSGGGGPWRRLTRGLERNGVAGDLVLTDRFPNLRAAAALEPPLRWRVAYHPESVDARAVPAELAGFRTMFSAFHHFAPADARKVLADAVAARIPIGVFEATRSDASAILAILPIPFLVLLTMPFVRPFRWSSIALTYLLPLLPLLVLWDGFVSCLRTYTVAELRALVAEVPGSDGYTWDIGEAKGKGPLPLTYLVGVPKLTA